MMWASPNDVAPMAQMKEAFCRKAKSIPIEKKRTFGILLFIKVAGIAHFLASFRSYSKKAGTAYSLASFRSSLKRAGIAHSRASFRMNPTWSGNNALSCVIPQTRRNVLRRGKWISQKFRRIFALDVRTQLALMDFRRVLRLY